MSLPSSSDEWIAMISGLDIGAASPSDAQIQILVEYLTGEAEAALKIKSQHHRYQD